MTPKVSGLWVCQNVVAIRVTGSAFGLLHSIARHATGSQRTHRAGTPRTSSKKPRKAPITRPRSAATQS